MRGFLGAWQAGSACLWHLPCSWLSSGSWSSCPRAFAASPLLSCYLRIPFFTCRLGKGPVTWLRVPSTLVSRAAITKHHKQQKFILPTVLLARSPKIKVFAGRFSLWSLWEGPFLAWSASPQSLILSSHGRLPSMSVSSPDVLSVCVCVQIFLFL